MEYRWLNITNARGYFQPENSEWLLKSPLSGIGAYCDGRTTRRTVIIACQYAERDIVVPISSVRPTPVMCPNFCDFWKRCTCRNCRHTFWFSSSSIRFLSPTAVTKFEGEPPSEVALHTRWRENFATYDRNRRTVYFGNGKR